MAHFPLAPFLCHCRHDTVLVDIQSKIEFFFHLGVFACSKLFTNWNAPEHLCVPAVRAALLRPTGVAREKYERQTHSSFQPRACALTSRPQP